jgi:pre-mRNA-processing factor 19
VCGAGGSRLVKERDEARQQLADASAAGKLYSGAGPAGPTAAPGPAQAGVDSMDVEAGVGGDDVGITDKVKDKMVKLAGELSKSRKKREIPASLASEGEVASYQEKSSHPVHLANAILCLDLHPSNPDMVASGGADNNVVLFDRKSGQAAQKMKGHSKKVLRVAFHPKQDMVFSASADKTVKVWTPSTGKCLYTFKDHKGDVTGVSVHATGDYVVSASLDKTWALYDLETGVCRKLVADAAVKGGYSTAAFHPDGLILGTGTVDSLVRVWDVKTQQNVVTFEGHKGTVSSLDFSENGFYLVTAGPDGFKSWDLRKVAKQGAQVCVCVSVGERE